MTNGCTPAGKTLVIMTSLRCSQTEAIPIPSHGTTVSNPTVKNTATTHVSHETTAETLAWLTKHKQGSPGGSFGPAPGHLGLTMNRQTPCATNQKNKYRRAQAPESGCHSASDTINTYICTFLASASSIPQSLHRLSNSA